MFRISTAACLCGLAGAMGYALPIASGSRVVASAADPSPVTRVDTHGDVDMYCHGIDSPLKLLLSPARSVATAAGTTWVVKLGVTNNTDDAVRMRYGVELIDDKGRSTQTPTLSAITSLVQHGSQSFELKTPAGLTDGFYQLRVRAVGVADKAESSSESSFYFQVAHGEALPLDVEDFLIESRVNEGVTT